MPKSRPDRANVTVRASPASDAAGMLRFSTDAFPEHQKLDAYREIYSRIIIKHDIEPAEDHPFRFDGTLWHLPGLGLASYAVTPCRLPRGPQHIDGDDFTLSISLSGARVVKQCGREATIRPGEAVLTTSAYPGVAAATSFSRLFTLRFPREALSAAGVDSDFLLVRAIPRRNNALRLLIEYLGAIQRTNALTTSLLSHSIVAHVHDLASLVLGAKRDARELADRRGLRAARLAAVLRAIENGSGDPGLNAVVIARDLEVTPRYVHLLLEETGRSFTHHLLEHRLKRAAALLRDQRWRDRRVSDIALEAGFTDLSYFSRAFRQHYGATPSEMRAAAWLDCGN
jgi:AraC-like DNA-binding protein